MPVAGLKREAAERFIRTRLALSPLAFRPDIALYRATPQSGLTAWLAEQGVADYSPYWAYSWAGGAALSLYLRDQPDAVAGRSILDLGSGSGLAAIAAAKAGAARILAMESDPIGRIAIALNAEANEVQIDIIETAELPKVDVIIAGDIFYDADIGAQMFPILERARKAGTTVLIGDPFRRFLPIDRLQELARYHVPDFGSETRSVPAAIFTLRP